MILIDVGVKVTLIYFKDDFSFRLTILQLAKVYFKMSMRNSYTNHPFFSGIYYVIHV